MKRSCRSARLWVVRTTKLGRFSLLGILGACASPRPAADPQLAAQWMRTTLSFVRTERLGPPVASRISAYGALALYEGHAADARSTLRSLSGQLNGFAALPAPTIGDPVDGTIVAAEAERIVLDSLFRDGLVGTRRTIDSLAAAQTATREAMGVRRDERELAHAV